jgi:hypothetical protein
VGKEFFYKCVFQMVLEEKTSGTGGIVPGRYGRKWKVFWSFGWPEVNFGSPLK